MAEGKKSLRVLGSEAGDPVSRLAEGDSAGVIEELVRGLEAEPEDTLSWLRLGAVYLAIGHVPEAEQALAKAVALDGEDVEARLLYGDALARGKKLDAAAFQLVQARRLAPRDARVHRQLGVAMFDKGLFDKADAALAVAEELDPTDPRAPFVRGLVCDQRRDTAGALVHYRRAVALDPEGVDARCTLADALATMGELAEAATELERAQRLDRTNTRIAQNLEVLRRGLRELEGQRLLGKGVEELERSQLVGRAQAKRAGRVDDEVRYRSSRLELLVREREGVVVGLTAVLVDPEHAARRPDDVFEVTIVGRTGVAERADLATGSLLTFLREALGCPMTRAGELYAALLREASVVHWGGVQLAWRALDFGDGERIGLEATLR